MLIADVITTQQAMNMVTDGALFFLYAAGLAMIFGLMNIINFAHGSFIMCGAYAVTQVTKAGVSPWVGILVAIAVGLGIGLTTELLMIRWLYNRPWDTILATIGLSLIPIACVQIIFGKEIQPSKDPLSGSWDLGFTEYSSYRIFLLIVAVALFCGRSSQGAGSPARRAVWSRRSCPSPRTWASSSSCRRSWS
jgi:branched-subunit amino acid ABC-type transport system permease component